MLCGGLLLVGGSFSRTNTSVAVRYFNVELSSTCEDDLSLSCRNVVGDLSSVLSVVHEEKVDISWITNQKLVESVLEQVTGLLVGSITDLWCQFCSLVLSANSVINTSWFSPGFLLFCVFFINYCYYFLFLV